MVSFSDTCRGSRRCTGQSCTAGHSFSLVDLWGLYSTKMYLQLSVVVAHGLQEAVVLPGLVGLETQVSFQGLLLAFQTLQQQRH